MRSDLLLLVDGRFPAGGHAWSAGVEAAVDVGDVVDAPTLERYLAGRLATTGVVDAAFAAATCAAVVVRAEFDRVVLLDREYSARMLSPHLRATSRRQGRQLLRAAHVVWPDGVLDAVADIDDGAHQPVVLGAVVGVADGTPTDAAQLALHHVAAAVTSAGIRLLGLDPIELAAAQARAIRAASTMLVGIDRWVVCDPGELPASGGSLTDILGEEHGRRDARLFVA